MRQFFLPVIEAPVFSWLERRTMLTLVVAILACGGCSSDERLQGPGRPPDPPPALARPVVSRLSAPAGSRIAIAIEAAPEGGAVLSGLQGELRFDPAALRYAGQEGYDSLVFPLVIVNDAGAGAGTLRVLSLDPAGLSPQTAVLTFDVLRADYAGTLRYTTDMAVTTALAVLPDGGTSADVGEDAALRIPAAPIRLGPADWTRLEATWGLGARLIDSIPTGRRFGDVTGNGAVDVVDASRVGNWAVGNPSPAGTPIPAPGDLAELVGNVAPFNSPGLGETADTKGPGWDATCVRLWDVLDASNISNEAVGTDRPVVGELVPGDAVDPGTGLPRRGAACLPNGDLPPAIQTGLAISSPVPRVTDPSDPTKYQLRTYFEVGFQDTVSGSLVGSFLTTFRARIVGGSANGVPGYDRYYVLTADPGPTWAVYDSLYQAITRYPGVKFVLRNHGGYIFARGRFPVDPGLASSREAWWSNGGPTWAWRAVRAPLAWGCETGSYGGNPVRIGVLDLAFDSVPSDIPAYTAPVPFVDTLYADTLHWEAVPEGWDYRHGARVASILSARGDNDLGIAGMIWKSDLALYRAGSATLQPRNDLRRIEDLFLHAGDPLSGRQVLLTAASFGQATDTARIRFYYEAIRYHFLVRNTSGLLVVALGNRGNRVSLGELADPLYSDTSHMRDIGAFDRALARLVQDGFGSRILFVAGANASGALAGYSDWITAAPVIAAPSDSVVALDPGGQARLDSGNSYAAPIVAGVAAQLLAMDPTLTPAQVKDYILRGAQEPKFDPFTGQYISDSLLLRVQGAPEPVYQLDAYGSLSLLSRERPNVPICGYEVALGSLPTWEVKLARREGDTVRIPVTGGEAQGVSVAQGGRRLAVRVFNLATGISSRIYDHTGNLIHTVTGVERQFLEQDTADVAGTGVTLSGPGGPRSYPNVFSTVDQGHSLFYPGRVRVSPDGLHALIQSTADDDLGYLCPDGTGAHRFADRVHVVPLGSAGPAVMLLDTDVGVYCPNTDPGQSAGPLSFAWGPDGQRAMATRWNQFYTPFDPNLVVTGENSLVREWSAGAGVVPYTIAQREIKNPRYTADGFAWRFWEYTIIGAAPNCWTTTRSRANPASPLIEVGAPAGADCFLSDFEETGTPLTPNLRAVSRRLSSAASSRSRLDKQ